MPMPCLLSDLAALFTSNDFGEADGEVYWKGTAIEGAIFDDEDVEVQTPDGASEIVHQAVLTAPSAQFHGIAAKDTVTVRGRVFRVRHWMDDGTGVIEIFLGKA